MGIRDNIDANLRLARGLDEFAIAYDMVFVVNVNSRGWILEKICKVIAASSSYHTTILYTERNDSLSLPLPAARAYFFSHYALYIAALEREPLVASALRFVWFTHPSTGGKYTLEDIGAAMRHVTTVFTANTGHAGLLQDLGVEPGRIATILGAADPGSIRFKARGCGRVGFIGAYYERKNPDLMLEVVRAMPDIEFLLLGPSPEEVENSGLLWTNWTRYEELASLPNIRIVEAAYADYPARLDGIDIYVSLSKLEGGPIPIVEALFANAIPIATRTGFAEDIIRDGRNGHLLELDCGVEEVAQKIRYALTDRTTNVRDSALQLSWSAFGKEFWRHIFPVPASGTWLHFAREDDVLRHCREGFGSIEARGIGLAGRQARLVIPRSASAGAPSQLSLRFRVKHLPRPKDCSLEIRLDGVPLGRASFSANRQHEWTLPVPDGVPLGEKYVVSILDRTELPTVSHIRLEEMAIFEGPGPEEHKTAISIETAISS